MTYSKHINCLDLEYKGARPFNKIIEIGLTVVNAETRQIEKSYSYPISYANKNLLNIYKEGIHLNKEVETIPGSSLDYWTTNLENELAKDYVTSEIQELTGWSQRKLNRQGEPLSKVITRLETKHGSKNRICVVDCANEFDLFGEDCPFKKWINVSDLYRIKQKNFKGVTPSLLSMLTEMNLEFSGNLHSAKDDSFNIAKLFLSLI